MTEDHKTLLFKAYLYRGKVVELAIVLEKAIEEYILAYITTDLVAKYKITVYLIDRMTFDGKISVLQNILKPNLEASEYKKLMAKLRIAKEDRNFFAHQLTSYSQEDISLSEAQITFVNFRNDINRKTFKTEALEKITANITNVTSIIYRLKDVLEHQRTTN